MGQKLFFEKKHLPTYAHVNQDEEGKQLTRKYFGSVFQALTLSLKRTTTSCLVNEGARRISLSVEDINEFLDDSNFK